MKIDNYEKGFAVTPHDTNDLAAVADAFWVGTSGHIAVITAGGDTITLNSAAAGVVHTIRVKRIKSTGTTASNIVALYSGRGA